MKVLNLNADGCGCHKENDCTGCGKHHSSCGK